MNIMEKLAEKANSGRTQAQFDPNDISKIASQALDIIANSMDAEETMSKQAEEAMTKLSAEEQIQVREYVAQGRGFARGEMIGKEAGYQAGVSDAINSMIAKTAEYYGEEIAIKIAEMVAQEAGITEDDVKEQEDIDALKQEITSEAASQLVQEAGGEENLSPEQAEKIMEIAEAAGEIGLQQVMGQGEDGGEDGGEEEPPGAEDKNKQ